MTEEESNPEHILPLALGGCGEFIITVARPANSSLGSEIDGAITNDFVIRFARREFDARGHSGKEPKTVFKKAAFEGRPAQVTFLGGDNLPLIWDAMSKTSVDPEAVAGKQVTVRFQWDQLIQFRFVAKVALSAGYFAFGEYWRRYVDHAQARLWRAILFFRWLNYISLDILGLRNNPFDVLVPAQRALLAPVSPPFYSVTLPSSG